MVFISILAIGAVSAADDGADIEVISDADDSTDVLSVEEDADQVGIDDAEKETVIADGESTETALSAAVEPIQADDGNATSSASSGKKSSSSSFDFSSFSFGNSTSFNFSSITFDTGNGTFDFASLLNGTSISFGNGTSLNISSLLNSNITFGNGTSLNISSLLNFTGTNGTGSVDLSSILGMLGGSKLSAQTADIDKVYSGATVFTATILNSDKAVGAGNNVIFSINNKDYIARTDANGTASVKLSLKAGTYYIYTEYNNEI